MAQVVFRKPACQSEAKSNRPSTRMMAGAGADRLPRKQFTFRARQQAVWESRSDTAAVEIDRAALLTAGEDGASTEGVTTLAVDQPCPQQQIEAIAQIGQVTAQVTARRV